MPGKEKIFFFRKGERLCSKKAIEAVYATGRSFTVFPYKISFLESDKALPYPAQVVIVAGKRHFKNAADRNIIKKKNEGSLSFKQA